MRPSGRRRDGIEQSGVADVIERLAGSSLVAIDHDRASRGSTCSSRSASARPNGLTRPAPDPVIRRRLESVASLAAKAGLRFLRQHPRWTRRSATSKTIFARRWSARSPGSIARRRSSPPRSATRGSRSDSRTRCSWLVRALEAAPGAPDLIRAMALFGAGMLAENALDYDQAVVHLRERSPSPGQSALACGGVGVGRLWDGPPLPSTSMRGRPRAWLEELSHLPRIEEAAGIGWVLSSLAEEKLKAGDSGGAASLATGRSIWAPGRD